VTFKTKLLLITVLPIVAITLLIGAFTSFQASRLIEAQTKAVEERIIANKKLEIQNYISLALTSIEPYYRDEPGGRKAAQEDVKRILNTMTFGDDGYFFVYTLEGTNVVHPKLAHLVGNGWWDLQDPEGDYVIRNLIKAAKNGGGFHRYVWNKPSTNLAAEKIGYAVLMEKWDWMLGTGLYIDDIAREVDVVKAEMTENIRQTALVIFLIAIFAVMGVSALIAAVRFSEQRFADSKLKELTNRIVDVQEQERKRVSSELHDSISQMLVSVRYGIEMIHSKSAGTPELQQHSIKCLGTLDSAISEVRRISRDLRPSVLDDMGLASALVSLGKEFESQSGIHVEIAADRCRSRLGDAAKTALYRVVQEALTNVARHADASQVEINLSVGPGSLALNIRDDGIGLPAPQARPEGLGLRNMQERIETHGGSVMFARMPTGGTLIRVTMPLSSEQQKAA